MTEKEHLKKLQKEARKEVLERIKEGKLVNGLYPLVSSIGGFTNEEKYEVLKAWTDKDFKRLIGVYAYPILENSLEKMEAMDKEHFETLKNEGKLGR